MTLRSNINETLKLKQCLQKMFEFSKCTYRVPRSYKVAQKRLLFRIDMHSQHKHKCLTIKAMGKKRPNHLLNKLRNKKTNCPSALILK